MGADADGSKASRAFWTDWVLWEKFTFILIVAIALTMAAGAVKLVYKRWQLKNFIKLEEEGKDVEDADGPQMEEMVPENHVPFGIRAIESGVEVEGVWISRPNSPAPSILASPVSSAATLPSPKKGAAAVRSPSILPSTAPGPTFAATRQPTGPPGMNKKPQNDAPAGDPSRSARPNYKPLQASHLRYSSGDIHEEREEEGIAQSSESAKNGNRHDPQHSPPGSTSSESDSVLVPRSSPAKRQDAKTKYTLPILLQNRSPIDTSFAKGQKPVDFDSLATYRSSQAAETGQLKVRKRPDAARSNSDKHSGKSGIAGPGPHTPPPNPFDDPSQTPGLESQGVQSFQSFIESDPNNASQSSLPLLEDVDLVDPLDGMQSKKANNWKLNTKTIRKVNDDYAILSPMSTNPFESEAEREAKRNGPTGYRNGSLFSEAI